MARARFSVSAAFALALALACGPALAQNPAPASDAAVDRRVQALSNELRCLVCQNQTLADSNADLAVDLRNAVREQVVAGRTDDQIFDYLVARYGDFVLYRPPFKATTALLWAGPFVLLLAAVGVLLGVLRRRRSRAAEAPPDAEEQARAAALLGTTGPGRGDT